MWMIYLVMTFAFTGLIMLVGVPLWDSLNLVMVAIATGGFTVHAGGLAYYDNPLLEILLIPVMLAGAIPFKVFFFLYHGKVREMFRDKTMKVFLLIALSGSLLTSYDLYIFSSLPPVEALRQGAFTAISGLCTCGLQNSVSAPVAGNPDRDCRDNDVHRRVHGKCCGRRQGEPCHACLCRRNGGFRRFFFVSSR